MITLNQKIFYVLKFITWVFIGYFSRTVTLATPQKATVLITYFNPARMKNVNHQIRNVLKCNFVERLIISNHNPAIQIQDLIPIRDERLTVLNQPVKRGCGFRWQLANQFEFDHLVVIDDDFLLFPGQLADLFKILLAQPEIPHGLSGMNYLPEGGFEFRDRQETDVDFLCEVYALTRQQLNQYLKMTPQLSSNERVANIVDAAADFMVISQTGTAKPRIHDVGRLFRHETFKMEGIAIHKDHAFDQNVELVLDALQSLGWMRTTDQ